MKLYSIWKQYPQSYPGECFPDCDEVATEYLNDDNPDWLAGEIKKAEQEVASGEIEAFRVIEIRVNEDDVLRAFRNVTVEGVVFGDA